MRVLVTYRDGDRSPHRPPGGGCVSKSHSTFPRQSTRERIVSPFVVSNIDFGLCSFSSMTTHRDTRMLEFMLTLTLFSSSKPS